MKTKKNQHRFSVEHVGVVIKDAQQAAAWYEKHLGFSILRIAADKSAAFVRAPDKKLIFEFIRAGAVPALDKHLAHPLQVHFAFKSKNFEQDKRRLVRAGALFVMDCRTADPKAKVCVLKDPFGLFLQLAQRKTDFYA